MSRPGLGTTRTAATCLSAGVAFLLGRQGEDGLWRDFRTPAGEASTWPTAVIGHALQGACAGPDAVLAAAGALRRTQRPDGGCGLQPADPR